jgi:hypothetical protein
MYRDRRSDAGKDHCVAASGARPTAMAGAGSSVGSGRSRPSHGPASVFVMLADRDGGAVAALNLYRGRTDGSHGARVDGEPPDDGGDTDRGQNERENGHEHVHGRSPDDDGEDFRLPGLVGGDFAVGAAGDELMQHVQLAGRRPGGRDHGGPSLMRRDATTHVS